jgi:hypothetical protein
MPAGIRISLHGFDVDIGEFVRLIRDLASAKLDAQTLDALKTMIAEVRKSFDVAVDVVTPLYALNSEATLRSEFPKLYANFKNAYLKNSGEIRTHCHIVIDQFERLKATQAWKQNIPVVRNAFQRLMEAEAKWAGADDSLADKMNSFLGNVDTELSRIDTVLQTDAAAGLHAVRELRADTEQQIKSIKSHLDELRIISGRLGS